MPCKCITDDGVPSLCCDGTCDKYKRIINPLIQERAMEDLFTTNQLQQIKSIVRESLSVSPILDKVWQEGFIKGFKEGYEYGRD